MRHKILAVVRGGVLKFEGVQVRGGQGGDINALRKWMEGYPKAGPWVCRVCQERVEAEGARVAVWVDLEDATHFEVMHREHSD